MPSPKKTAKPSNPAAESTADDSAAQPMTGGQRILARQKSHTGEQSEADKVISGIGAADGK